MHQIGYVKGIAMNFDVISDQDILTTLGSRLKDTRLQQRLSQDELATLSGVGIATVKRVESGDGMSLTTLIALLRALGKLHQLESLLADAGISPLQAATAGKRSKPVQRIRRKSPPSPPVADNTSTQVQEPAAGWVWGDEDA
ncbi:helix-turn-helix domain-containing protein [Pokkaliibacter plantistimulans]|nr:helix-turn-helix transcriptional regulator [Pokkaliibacter plantistimulans]